MSKKSIRITVLVSLTLILIIHLLNHYNYIHFSKEVLLALRVVVCLVLLVYAIRKKKLTTWILVSMWIGAELGHDLPGIAMHMRIIGQVFLKLVKCIIAPLLFATLAYGIAGHSNLKQVGRIAWKSILYFEIVTTIALFIGLIAINITKPGEHIGSFTSPAPHEKIVVPAQTWEDVVLHIFPDNIAKSVAEGQILQIVIFSILFGIGLALVNENQKLPMLSFLESLSETMFKFTNVVMYAAPFAVGASIAYTVSQQGIGILINLKTMSKTHQQKKENNIFRRFFRRECN